MAEKLLRFPGPSIDLATISDPRVREAFEELLHYLDILVLELGRANINTADIVDNAVTTPKIAPDAVDDSRLADNAVGNEHLQDDAVDTAEIADSAVITAKLGPDAVDSTKLADNAVGNEHLQNAAIDTPELADNAVETAKLNDAAVTLAKLDDVLILDGEYDGSETTLTGSFVSFAEATIATGGKAVKIVASARFEATATSSSANLPEMQIVRDSTVVWGPVQMVKIRDLFDHMLFMAACHIDEPVSGTYTYKLEARDTRGSTPLAKIKYASIVAETTI